MEVLLFVFDINIDIVKMAMLFHEGAFKMASLVFFFFFLYLFMKNGFLIKKKKCKERPTFRKKDFAKAIRKKGFLCIVKKNKV